MYDSEFIKKTHRNRGKKIFSPPSSVCLKEKESKFARETSALTQSPSDGKSTSINPAEMQRELLVVCRVLISSCAQRKSKVSQYQTSLQWTKLACFQQISWLSSLESAETLLPPTLPSRMELLNLISQTGIAHFASDASRNYPDVFYLFFYSLF